MYGNYPAPVVVLCYWQRQLSTSDTLLGFHGCKIGDNRRPQSEEQFDAVYDQKGINGDAYHGCDDHRDGVCSQPEGSLHQEKPPTNNSLGFKDVLPQAATYQFSPTPSFRYRFDIPEELPSCDRPLTEKLVTSQSLFERHAYSTKPWKSAAPAIGQFIYPSSSLSIS